MIRTIVEQLNDLETLRYIFSLMTNDEYDLDEELDFSIGSLFHGKII